jgi:3-oxoacyl-[acyl-carrier protein] reductase
MADEFEASPVLVTGASRGIGRGIAEAFAEAGAQVVLTSRDGNGAREVAAAITARGGRARGVALDVAAEEDVQRVSRALLDEYGRIAVLVNNAGITRDSLLLRMKAEDWEAVLGTNLGGIYRLTKALLPAMIRARTGRIVNISSVVATTGNAGQTGYAASKAAIEGFTRSLAREVASRNVTVNCVAPGYIDTEMTRALDEGVRRRLAESIPLGRLGRPEDVAAAVLFLCGPGAGYITGSVLHVNGGMYM